MDRSIQVDRPLDPLAVAVANLSLLGIGYLMLRRRVLAITTTAITFGLITLLVCFVRDVWFEVMVLLWWVAVAAHGWILAGGRKGRVWTQRLLALAVTVPVLATVALLRVEAARIETDVAEARRVGDCTRAQAAADQLWVGDRIADAPLTDRVDGTVRACRLIRRAEEAFRTATTGHIDSLATGFELLTMVLTELPGHQTMVGRVVDGLVEQLPSADVCDAVAITDWIAQQHLVGDALGRAADAVPRIAPAALVGCGDKLMTASDWTHALARYQQFLVQYPQHALADRARNGAMRAAQAMELAVVRELLRPPSPGAQPAYCRTPKPYSGAPPYRNANPNRALLFGNDADTAAFPAEWRANDAADAIVVICADRTEFGAAVETCPYITELTNQRSTVTFRKKAVPVHVYEVRTGRLVTDARIEIGGASCPGRLNVPGDVLYVDAAPADVRAAFDWLINPR
ncbi:hypothetical protein [Nocardia anaemiae]|uniref:hypothetical protein n=1 Tax=Nocardia anaemiae TaxID=263910 RepID=UPI0007A560EE|nr:hypothetical protein [Nocardia anaemiae]